MNKDFWLSRWREGRTPFHLATVNPLLRRFGERMTGGVPRRVFVPLCGKSLDMAYLAGLGHQVAGVEIADIAVRAFFEESGVPEGGPVTIHTADFFDLDRETLGRIDCVYDRAALIALPERDRPRYAARLRSFVEPGDRLLLITIEYDPQQMEGPPYSVPPDEVAELFSGWGEIEKLSDEEILDREPRFRERGLTWLREAAWLITG